MFSKIIFEFTNGLCKCNTAKNRAGTIIGIVPPKSSPPSQTLFEICCNNCNTKLTIPFSINNLEIRYFVSQNEIDDLKSKIKNLEEELKTSNEKLKLVDMVSDLKD
jgi:hypothetical protein